MTEEKPLRVDVPPDVFSTDEYPGPYVLRYRRDQTDPGVDVPQSETSNPAQGAFWKLTPDSADIRALLDDVGVEHVVVFVHGYNTTRDEACHVFQAMIPQIAACYDSAMRARTRYLCVTWDSRCNRSHWPHAATRPLWRLATLPLGFLAYMDDLDNVTYASAGIAYLLNDIAHSDKKLYLIGHSMGCQAIINYLSQMALCHLVRSAPYFGGNDAQGAVSRQILDNVRAVFLLAPDVPTHRIRYFFKFYYPAFSDLDGLERFVFVSSNWDLAIWASQTLRLGSSRAGIPDNIDACLNAPEFLHLIAGRTGSGIQVPDDFRRKQQRRRYPPLELYDLNAVHLFGHGLYASRSVQEVIGCCIRETAGGSVPWSGVQYGPGGMTKQLRQSTFVDAIPGRLGLPLIHWKKK